MPLRLSLVVAFVAAVWASSPSSAETVFHIRRGMNIGGPFAGITEKTVTRNGQAVVLKTFRGYVNFTAMPYVAPPRVSELGFDFVRLIVNPIVLLRVEGKEREEMFQQVNAGVNLYRAAGLKVIYNLHFWTPDERWTAEKVLTSRNGEFEAYREIVRRSAEILAQQPEGEVAFEPFNEPVSSNCHDAETGWLVRQRILLDDIRRVSKSLPVVICGCFGQTSDLVKLGPKDIDLVDPALIYSGHFYEPIFFTGQSNPGHHTRIHTVLYPATRGNLDKALAGALETIDNADIPPEKKLREKQEAIHGFAAYYAASPGRHTIQRYMGEVKSWADKYRITPDRILIGEFAALNWTPGDTPEWRASRIAWARDVQAEAEAAGFAWGFWAPPLKDDLSDVLDLKQKPPP